LCPDSIGVVLSPDPVDFPLHLPSLGLAIINPPSPQWSQRLNSYLNGLNSELILVSLKLFNGMSGFASGRERRAVLDIFAWENQPSKLLNMRRRIKSEPS
jgi:nucleolar pre-ribosomal-associated protein 1